MTSRLGMTVPLPGIPLAEHREWLRQIVDLGYSDCWTMETAGLDAFTPLATVAAWAPELRLGTAIASVFTRGPALLAQQAAAIAEAAPGRFVLGIGSSSDAMVRGWNGIPFESPYARVRDSLRFLRAALRGERVQGKFETFETHGFELERVPAQAPPIYLAGLRRDMLRLAGREGDGALLSLVAARDVPHLAATVREGSSGVSRELVLRIGVFPTPDAEFARARCRRLIAAYLNLPAYAGMHEWLGRADELAPLHAAWRAGDRKGALEAISDELVDALFVHGEPAACREQIEAFSGAGVTTPVISILPFGGGPDDLARAVRDLAPR
ncbi:MAG: LLM class F420-dependent oxidoreductase [Myxococcota bacterium]